MPTPEKFSQSPGDPFADDAENGFFFTPPALQQRFNLLHHLIQYSDLLLMVIGEQGAGKTTLMNRLIAEANEPWRVAVLEAHLDLDRQLFLKGVLFSTR